MHALVIYQLGKPKTIQMHMGTYHDEYQLTTKEYLILLDRLLVTSHNRTWCHKVRRNVISSKSQPASLTITSVRVLGDIKSDYESGRVYISRTLKSNPPENDYFSKSVRYTPAATCYRQIPSLGIWRYEVSAYCVTSSKITRADACIYHRLWKLIVLRTITFQSPWDIHAYTFHTYIEDARRTRLALANRVAIKFDHA